MAESRHSQIVEALRTRLAAIVGDGGSTYWYTPARVVRAQVYDRLLADDSVGTPIYALRAGEETHEEESTGDAVSGGGIRARAEVFVLLMARTQAADDSPFGFDGETKALEQDRMIRDVLKKLWQDVTLGGLATNLSDGQLVVDREVDVEGWACVEVRLAVVYSYLAGTP